MHKVKILIISSIEGMHILWVICRLNADVIHYFLCFVIYLMYIGLLYISFYNIFHFLLGILVHHIYKAYMYYGVCISAQQNVIYISKYLYENYAISYVIYKLYFTIPRYILTSYVAVVYTFGMAINAFGCRLGWDETFTSMVIFVRL